MKEEYKKILKSKEFKIFENSVEEFSAKMNFEPASVLLNKEEFYHWIKLNISLTDFKNINEAELQFSNLTENYKLILEKNKSFYGKIFSLEKKQFKDLLSINYKNVNIADASGGPCEFDCINTAVGCSNTVNANYEDMMNAAGLLYQNGNIIGAALASAYAAYYQNSGQATCAADFNSCYEACGD